MINFINLKYKDGYEVKIVDEIHYVNKETLDPMPLIRKDISSPEEMNPIYEFYLPDGSMHKEYLPSLKYLKKVKSKRVHTIQPNTSRIIEKKCNLDELKLEIQKASIKINNTNQDMLIKHISILINKYGTLQSLSSLNSIKAYDNEFLLWKILLTKFIPSVYSFIKSKNNLSIKELNMLFMNVRPSYKDISRQAYEFTSKDLVGAIALHHKTNNLKKPPLAHCVNCGNEINQNQGRGRPSNFCKNNNKCKMQYYRKVN